MTGVRRRAFRLAVTAGALVVLCSCGGQVAGSPGTATPADTEPTEVPTTTTEALTTTTTPDSESPLADIDPCTLLTDDERDQLDIPDAVRDDVGSIPGCQWKRRGSEKNATASARLQLAGGLDDLVPAGHSAVADTTVNDRRARKIEFENTGGCRIDLAVGDHSMVTVSALIVGELSQSCDLVDRAAAAVEPKLPRG